MLCLYDNTTYTFIGNKIDFPLSEQEIDNLNLFQFFNTENSIYFFKDDSNFEKFNALTRQYRNTTSTHLLEKPITNNRQIIVASQNDYTIRPMQSFLAIKEKNLYLPLTYEYMQRPITKDVDFILGNDPRFKILFQ